MLGWLTRCWLHAHHNSFLPPQSYCPRAPACPEVTARRVASGFTEAGSPAPRAGPSPAACTQVPSRGPAVGPRSRFTGSYDETGPEWLCPSQIAVNAGLSPSFSGRSSFALRGDGNPDLPFTPARFSVHRLKLADIKVIGALGDSLTVSALTVGGRGGALPDACEDLGTGNLTHRSYTSPTRVLVCDPSPPAHPRTSRFCSSCFPTSTLTSSFLSQDWN